MDDGGRDRIQEVGVVDDEEKWTVGGLDHDGGGGRAHGVDSLAKSTEPGGQKRRQRAERDRRGRPGRQHRHDGETRGCGEGLAFLGQPALAHARFTDDDQPGVAGLGQRAGGDGELVVATHQWAAGGR